MMTWMMDKWKNLIGRPARLSTGARCPAGFTLVELLVVIGIIALLIGILLPSLVKARASSRDIKSMSGLRQMLIGYTMYHQENRGMLLWGFTPMTVNGVLVKVEDPRSGHVFQVPIADRYPWRLLPYVSDIWQIIHSHDIVPAIPTADDSGLPLFEKAYRLSINPTYGINAIFLGGHKDYSGFVGPGGDRPNYDSHVAFRTVEIRRAAEIIVFADSQGVNIGAGEQGKGFHILTPPRAHGLRWNVVNGNVNVLTPDNTGIPKGWNTKFVVTGFFDGHVELRLPNDLQDMRNWSPKADRPDWDY